MIKILLVFFISALSISASTNYPDYVNEIVRDRIFLPMENCMSQDLLDSIKNGTFTKEMWESRTRLSDCFSITQGEYDGNISCLYFIRNYFNADSIKNVITDVQSQDELVDFQNEIISFLITTDSDWFISYKQYLQNQYFDVRPIIQRTFSFEKEIGFYFSEFNLKDSLSSESNKYIPNDIIDLVNHLDSLFVDPMRLNNFKSNREQLAVFEEMQNHSFPSIFYYLDIRVKNRFFKYLLDNKLVYYDATWVGGINIVAKLVLTAYHRKINNKEMKIDELINEAKREIEFYRQLERYKMTESNKMKINELYKAYLIIEKRKREKTNSSITPNK